MSTSEVRVFDPVAYKSTTREQWQTTAEAWHRWGPTLEAWLGQATQAMLDMAGVKDGARVLDVAAGAGGQTDRGGPTGRAERDRSRHRHLPCDPRICPG